MSFIYAKASTLWNDIQIKEKGECSMIPFAVGKWVFGHHRQQAGVADQVKIVNHTPFNLCYNRFTQNFTQQMVFRNVVNSLWELLVLVCHLMMHVGGKKAHIW